MLYEALDTAFAYKYNDMEEYVIIYSAVFVYPRTFLMTLAGEWVSPQTQTQFVHFSLNDFWLVHIFIGQCIYILYMVL